VLLVDRVPEPELRRDPAVEPVEDVERVGALRRRRQTQELARAEALEQARVRLRRRVVELVDDDDVEVVRLEPADAGGREALDRREHVLEAQRPVAADPAFAERRLAQRVAERRQALVEDLGAVRDEQQPVAGERSAEPRVVDRGHHGLSRPGRRDDQVAPVTLVQRDRELLEQRLLERPELDLDRAEQQGRPDAFDARAPRELLAVVVDEVAPLPVAVEDGAELLDGVAIPGFGDADVPLEAGHLRGVREVGRADVRGRVAARAVEDPGLRVQARRGRVVRDADVGAESRELVERALLRAAGVRRREDAQRLAVGAVPAQRVDERAHAAPADEGDHGVDRVGRAHLGAQLVHEAWLARSVGEDGRVEQRGQRPFDRVRSRVGAAPEEGVEHLRRLERDLTRDRARELAVVDELAQPAQERGRDESRSRRPLALR